MNKTVADLAVRWLARNADALTETELRVSAKRHRAQGDFA